MTRKTVEDAWHGKEQARDSDARARAERNWRDVIFHSVLDVLDQLDAVPWQIGEWPYDACLERRVAMEIRGLR